MKFISSLSKLFQESKLITILCIVDSRLTKDHSIEWSSRLAYLRHWNGLTLRELLCHVQVFGSSTGRLILRSTETDFLSVSPEEKNMELERFKFYATIIWVEKILVVVFLRKCCLIGGNYSIYLIVKRFFFGIQDNVAIILFYLYNNLKNNEVCLLHSYLNFHWCNFFISAS